MENISLSENWENHLAEETAKYETKQVDHFKSKNKEDGERA